MAIRAFVAFEMPQDVIHKIAHVQDRLQRYDLKIRWVNPKNIHLTLKFLGDIAKLITFIFVEPLWLINRALFFPHQWVHSLFY